jgi:hypothetical protein
MSIGPQPSLSGGLFSGPDSSVSWALDANGDVTASGCGSAPSGSCSNTTGSGSNDGSPPIGGLVGGSVGSDSSGTEGDALCGPPISTGCVSPNTRIALFPEGCKAAWEVEVGDLLLTRSDDGAQVGEAVTGVRVSRQPCVVIESEDRRQLHCSLSHEVMVYEETCVSGRRVCVSSLTLADRLLLADGTAIAIVALIPQPEGEVIQLSLSGPHHLYLSEGLWSHNKTGGAVWPVPP